MIERYIYAATRQLPRRSREDVSRELQGLIDDMLLERCGDLTPTEKDIRVVLTELGSPRELYEKYDENSQKCLIGQPYCSTYLVVLKVAMICGGFGLTLSSIILQVLEPKPWYTAVWDWFWMLWAGLLQGFSVVTLLFAFFYRKNVKLEEPFNFDDLPAVPKKNEEIPRWESIVGIAFSVVFAVLFLTVPEWICIFYKNEAWIPMFDGGVMQSTWYIILALTLVGLLREIVKLTEKRYNRRVLMVTIGCNSISAALAIWWLTAHDLLSNPFKETMTALFVDESDFLVQLFGNFQYFFLGVILFALLLDAMETVVKSLRK